MKCGLLVLALICNTGCMTRMVYESFADQKSRPYVICSMDKLNGGVTEEGSFIIHSEKGAFSVLIEDSFASYSMTDKFQQQPYREIPIFSKREEPSGEEYINFLKSDERDTLIIKYKEKGQELKIIEVNCLRSKDPYALKRTGLGLAMAPAIAYDVIPVGVIFIRSIFNWPLSQRSPISETEKYFRKYY